MSFVNDRPVRSAMRDLLARLTSIGAWGVLASIGVILGIAGPFGTYQHLPLAGRLAYWLVVTAASYAVAFLVCGLLARLLSRAVPSAMLRNLLCGAVAGLLIWLLVTGLNALVFGAAGVRQAPYILPAAIGISALVALTMGRYSAADARRATIPDARPDAAGQPRPPAILARLPEEKRGRLQYMSMQDHYVDIHTDKGTALVLMRFADAIQETEGVSGLRVHRSHWVAAAAVRGARRRNGRLYLVLDDGAQVPVSRSYGAAVRAAGWGGSTPTQQSGGRFTL
jgi:DNA-binding LytR/AlgR family response regulator